MQLSTRDVALIGLMASGKSTVGRALAERLGHRFVDTDDAIESATGRTVRELWEEGGEAAYRPLELQAVIEALSADDPVVLAVPGGIAVDDGMATAVTATDALVVYLRATAETLAARVANSGDDVDATIERKLAAGERLMGFGHRVFRLRDPRADMLRAALLRLDPNSPRLAFAQRVERAAVAALERRKPGRRLEANIEMDAALLLDAIGLPRDAFTPVFAMARAPAWIAHALEQRRSGRIIRPASAYVGPVPTA